MWNKSQKKRKIEIKTNKQGNKVQREKGNKSPDKN